MTGTSERFRIGELSRRVGLTEHVLRAWERRYGVLRPRRSAGGFRLYGSDDEARVRRMQHALDRGLSTAEAARTALAELPPDPAEAPLGLEEGRTLLAEALDNFDATVAHALLDRLLSGHLHERVLGEVVVPALRDIGHRWTTSEIDVAQEHFASDLLRRRVAAMLQETTVGPTAVLACPPGEQHDLPLLVHAVCLSRRGWHVVFLGADVPVDDLEETVARLRPTLLVLSATRSEPLDAVARRLRRLSASVAVAVAGAGATPQCAREAGALLLTDDPVAAATGLDRFHDIAPTEA